MRVHIDITDGSDGEDRRGDAGQSVTVAGTDTATDGGAAPVAASDATADAASWAASADDTGQPVDAGPPPADLLEALGTEPPAAGGADTDALDAGAAPDPED
jgi:hypothetical protein